MGEKLLEIKNLRAQIEDKSIIKGLNLSIKKGETHVIMGPNGCGKSTLSKILAGHPSYEINSGDIEFDAHDLLSMDPEIRSHEGLFLAFQYPLEIAGVTNFDFLRIAYNEKKKYHNQEELDPLEFMEITNKSTDGFGVMTVVLAEEKGAYAFDEQNIKVRYLYSQARLTGHDFLQIGTGGTSTTNWPGVPTVSPIPSREINEGYPGRIFYVSTDQEGNFRVGKYFRVNQATGSATLNASAFDLSGLTSLKLGSIGAQLGAQINEFSTDVTLSQNSNEKVPTQAAVKTYVDTKDASNLASAKVYSYFVSQSS